MATAPNNEWKGMHNGTKKKGKEHFATLRDQERAKVAAEHEEKMTKELQIKK